MEILPESARLCLDKKIDTTFNLISGENSYRGVRTAELEARLLLAL